MIQLPSALILDLAADKLLIRDNMKSAIRSPNLEIWPLVRFWLIKRPLRPLAVQDPSAFIARFGKPVRPPPAPKRRKRARGRLSGKLFREARRTSPQRQNDGSEREGGCRRSFGRRPENCFGKPDGPAPSARTTERVRATARVCHGCFGKQRASSQRQNYGSASNAPLRGLTKRPLRLAGLDKVAILQALDKNGSA